MGDRRFYFAVAFALDNTRKDRKAYLTDAYSLDPTLNGGQPIDMTPYGGVANAFFMNKDGDQNQGNIRFRHTNNTQANVLMLDGHVQIFNLNKNTKTPDLLRKNIYVTPN